MIRKLWLLVGFLASPALLWPGSAARADGPALVPFASIANHYRIDYPAGWRHTVGHLGGAFSLFTFDQFVDPARPGGFPVNVVVARLPLAAPTTDAALLTVYEASLGHRARVAEVGYAHLAGRTITLIGYADVAQHLQAYLADGTMSWVFSLTAARSDRGPWQPLFVRILATFQAAPR